MVETSTKRGLTQQFPSFNSTTTEQQLSSQKILVDVHTPKTGGIFGAAEGVFKTKT